ncbi:MAG: hypothetical protein NC097_07440 [Clostridium sp.]|nr:hypothetical protein [Prevotella sp.]MCM1429610.1 hypothetical protein [Clostridium sp.]MCM1476089.1 hypothetical protein [Muribaculaceae bacterium]
MTENNKKAVVDLLDKAKSDLALNMDERGIGAILWDNATAGFHYLPELALPVEDGQEPKTVRVMGIYNYQDTLYLIEEDTSGVNINDFYDHDTEVKPTVVTLTSDIAAKDFGDPTSHKGFTTNGDLEEWLAIADCYFEALAEE